MELEELKKYLSYDEETGHFTWIALTHKSVSKIKVGDRAGVIHSNGYIRIVVKQKKFYAHRLAWGFMTGEMPTLQVDHVNRIRHDNRFENLEEKSSYENNLNRGIYKSNRVGVTGVHKNKKTGRITASIRRDGITKHLGTFENIEEATKARQDAERVL